MDFDFSDDQKQLRSALRRTLAEICPPTVVQAVLDGHTNVWRPVWLALARAGYVGAMIPEDLGGSGGGYLELCIIAEEMGRVLAPTPFLTSAFMFTNLALRLGSRAQRHEICPALSRGDAIGCVVTNELFSGFAPRQNRLEIRGGRAYGTCGPVLDAAIADFCILPIATGDVPRTELWLARLNDDGVTRKTLQTIDPTRAHAQLTFSGARVERLGSPENSNSAFDEAVNAIAVLCAFEQLGGADRALEMARDYALERTAFGRPIGSFQAIKHMLADMYISATLARSNAYYGAWALSANSPELQAAAACAHLSASDAFRQCARNNIQVHGGMGFTWAAQPHLFYRRAHLLALTLGGVNFWSPRLINCLPTAATLEEEMV